ncbi:phage tail domain-containing protein [Streptomyces sp. WG5]|uniref:phage tail domain-containing protein n=1 Tax=Streptomyces sp. WG5 TaxID=3417648 RepID=UPI003CF3375C
MPIPVLRAAPPVPTPTGPQPPQRVHWGRTYVSIRGKNGEGEEIALTDFSGSRWPGIILMPGATGLDAPPYELHSDDSPNLDGGIFRDARAVSREIMIPVYLHGIDRRTVRSLKSRLVSALNPKKGYCILKFVEGDAIPRYLKCYYKSGMEGSETVDQAGFTWKKFGLQFTAYDPYFFSDDVQVAQWIFGTGEAFLGDPFFPLKLNAGIVSGSEVLVQNPGDVQAWPRWELTGPIKGFTFSSPDGSSFGITPPVDGTDVVAGGRTLVVDTRPGFKSLKDDQGTNYWPLLDDNPQLWAIPEGESTCTVDIVPGSANAKVRLVFQPQYEGY